MELDGRLVETCYKVVTTRNKFGDLEIGASEARDCLFRPISLMSQAVGNREQINIDGLFWFDATDDWAMGDLLLYESQYYRIEKLVKAKRRLVDNSLKFIKAEVILTRQVS